MLKDVKGYRAEDSRSKREISPWLAFSLPKLEKFLRQHREIKKIVIVGESHSGSLVHKNLLLISEKFKKEGLFGITPCTLARNCPKFRYIDPITKKVMNVNNGLDGDSARFIAGMVFDPPLSERYKGQWQYDIVDKKIEQV